MPQEPGSGSVHRKEPEVERSVTSGFTHKFRRVNAFWGQPALAALEKDTKFPVKAQAYHRAMMLHPLSTGA